MKKVRTGRYRARARRAMRDFRHNDDGTLVVFGLVVTVSILVLTGFAIDVMRTEAKRVELQGALDRSVLAAADGDQPSDRVQVVEDYMAASNMAQYLDGPAQYDPSFTARQVSASATMPVRTLMGTMADPLPVKARATAQDAVPHVEVSLVLDISGSMSGSSRNADGSWSGNRRIDDLKTASGRFLDTLLTDEMRDRVSINLVPYSEHVNIGPDLFSLLNVNGRHQYSHCVEFEDHEFSSPSIDLNRTFTQVQHLQTTYSSNIYNTSSPVCPRHAAERVTAWSQDRAALKAQINNLVPRVNTAIFLGMKWGAALLDPSTSYLNDRLVAQGKVDAGMARRPLAYDRDETLKAVVLMTDGRNTSSKRLYSQYYASSSWVEAWDRYNLGYLQYHYYGYGNYTYTKYWSSLGDTLLENICTSAKEAGIVIYGIGLEVDDHGRREMQKCVSSPSHYFDVNGGELDRAFQSIAVDVLRLRLIE